MQLSAELDRHCWISSKAVVVSLWIRIRYSRPKKEAFRLFPFSELNLGFIFLDPFVQGSFELLHHG
jgi:hypothetical protein